MIFDRLKEILMEMFGVEDEDEITRETLLEEDLFATEEDFIELAFILEEELDVERIKADDLMQEKTVGDIADLFSIE